MGVNCIIALPNNVQLRDVANAVGILAGLTPEQSKLGNKDSFYVLVPGVPDGRTRAERERDEAQARIAERKDRIAHVAANPPEVPANHGLRFLWNGIKVNSGELQRAYYSLGNLYDWPADTLTINARDYGSLRFGEVSACFEVENDTDIYSDYHDHDRIHLCSNHPLYPLVMEAYRKQEEHNRKRFAKRA